MDGSNSSIYIRSIKFKGCKGEIEFNKNDIVLLVGANNVGKSQTLRDLQEDIIGDKEYKKIIEKVEYETENFDSTHIFEFFNRNVQRDDSGQYCLSVSDNRTFYYSRYDFENENV